MTPASIMNELLTGLGQKPQVGEPLNAVVRFVITGEGGGVWTLDARDNDDPWVVEGGGTTPDMTLTMSSKTLCAIRKRTLPTAVAISTKKVMAEPFDKTLLPKLGLLLGSE